MREYRLQGVGVRVKGRGRVQVVGCRPAAGQGVTTPSTLLRTPTPGSGIGVCGKRGDIRFGEFNEDRKLRDAQGM